MHTLVHHDQTAYVKNHFIGEFHWILPLRKRDPSRGSNSAYLFIFALEILVLCMRQNIDIQGITIDDHEINISVYADDAKFLTINVHSME